MRSQRLLAQGEILEDEVLPGVRDRKNLAELIEHRRRSNVMES